MMSSPLPASSHKRRRILQRCTSLEQEPENCDQCDLSSSPPGIRSLKDLAEWPLDVATALCGGNDEKNEELRLRLRNHLLTGMILNTDYSGLDCPREAMEMGIQALKRVLDLEIPGSVLRVGRTCDKGAIQKRVQVELARSFDFEGGHQHCHFEDILHRLPKSAQDYISAATPNKSAPKADRAAAFGAIATWIMQNRSWLFSLDAESYCCVHDRRFAHSVQAAV